MKHKFKKIAVLGGAGLIGSFLVEHLVKKGHPVVVFDDFSKGKLSNLYNVKNKIEIIRIKLQTKKNHQTVMKYCRIFINLATIAYGIRF